KRRRTEEGSLCVRARTNSVQKASVADGEKPSNLLARNVCPRNGEELMRFAFKSTAVPILKCAVTLVLVCAIAGCGGYGSASGGGGGGNGSAPAIVIGLTANAANGQVGLSWAASSGATGYYVKRSTTSGTEAQIAALAGTTYSDTAVTNGTKYFYTVS